MNSMRDGVPVEKWTKVEDQPVLIYVVHQYAQHEPDERQRTALWEGWHIARWTSFNGGGWVWHGMLGRVTHVAELPARPAITSVERGEA